MRNTTQFRTDRPAGQAPKRSRKFADPRRLEPSQRQATRVSNYEFRLIG